MLCRSTEKVRIDGPRIAVILDAGKDADKLAYRCDMSCAMLACVKLAVLWRDSGITQPRGREEILAGSINYALSIEHSKTLKRVAI